MQKELSYFEKMALLKQNKSAMDKFFDKLSNGTPEEKKNIIDISVKCINEKKEYDYSNNHYNTNSNLFTGDKNSNNVKFVGGGYTNHNLSRNNCIGNSVNGITYSVTLF